MVRSTDGISFGDFDIFYMLLSTTGANQLDYQSYDSYIFRYDNKKNVQDHMIKIQFLTARGLIQYKDGI